MKEQVFLDFDLKFNLRQTRINKPTIIYAVFSFNGKQVKINTNTKVYPTQWNHKRQIATISNGQTSLYNNNNRIVNDTIKKIGIVFEEQKHYLCENVDEINNIFNLMKKSINPKYKSRMEKRNEPLATYIMNDFASLQQESTAKQYRTTISAFKKYLDEKDIENRLSNMNYDTFKSYQDYMCDEGYTIKTINDKITLLKGILKKISSSKKYDYKYSNSELDDLKKVIDNRSRYDKRSKQVALTENEIMRLYNMQGLKPKEQEYRDLFVLQCWTGQRVSDILKLFDNRYYLDDNTISFKNQKTKEEVVIKLDIEGYYIKDILNKYDNKNFQFIDIDNLSKAFDDVNLRKDFYTMCAQYNEAIKSICEKAELNRIIEYVEQKGIKVTTKKEILWRLIHSHSARHSYITNMLRRGITKDIVKITTGHTDDKMIDLIYQHLTREDMANKLHQGMNDISNKDNTLLFSPQSTNKHKIEVIETICKNNNNENYINNIEEAKEVLVFLGVDASEFIDIYDFTQLLVMIGRNEAILMDKLGIETTEKIKELFNSKASMKERKKLLQELIATIHRQS